MSSEFSFILVLSFLFLLLSTLVLTLSFFQIQPTVQEHEELVWLAGSLKLEVTEYSKWIYSPRGFAYLGGGDDDDNNGGGAGARPLLDISQGRGATSDDPANRETKRQS